MIVKISLDSKVFNSKPSKSETAKISNRIASCVQDISIEEFAEKVVQLLSDTNMRDRLAINGRHTVERSYSWLSKSKMLENLFREVLHRNAE